MNRNTNSGFWMDTNVLNQETDVITLNGYRRAIANFVRIVTGKQIPVTFNVEDHSYTDGEQVIISGQIKNDEFDSAVGLACHEASHILLSDFALLKRLVGPKSNPFQSGLVDDQLVLDVMKKYNVDREYAENYVKVSLKNLLNWVEDRRIDYHIFKSSPGYKGYYHAMYDKYFHSEIVTKGVQSSAYRDETMSSYMFRIINLTNEARDLKALKGLEEIFNLVDLKNIDRLKTSKDAFDVAVEIFEVIEKNVEGFDSQEDNSDMQQGQGQDGDDDNQKGDNQCDGEGKSGSGNGQPDPHKDFKGNDSSKNQPSGDQMEGDMQGGDDNTGEDSTEANGEGQGEGEDGEGDGNGSGEGEGEGEGEGGQSEGGQGEGDGQGQGEGQDQGGAPKNGSNQGGGSGGQTGAGQPLTDAEADAIKKAIEDQRAFVNHDIDKGKISQDKANELKAVESANSSLENVGKTYNGGSRRGSESIRKHGINCIVYRNMTRSFIESGACPFSYKNYWSSGDSRGYDKAVLEGLQKGVILGKKMQVRQESRNTYYNRQKKGMLDNRLVAEAGFGNSKIFGHVEVEQFAPAYVHISIDASGSMSGKKFYQAQVASVAIAKAATMVQGLDCVISYRGCASGKPAIMIAYDSRKDSISKIRSLFGAICPTGSTPEGLCFEAITDEIVMGNDKQYSYFVNMSDGEPGFSGHVGGGNGEYVSYGGQGAVEHTRAMVNKIKQRGVHVLSYFIGGGWSDHDGFKRMYGKDAAFVDVNNVMTIAKTMNKLFMKKAKDK